MRIIAGQAGGRKLKSAKGTSTRPTLDRIKESIFNMIVSYLPGAAGLDLFAGFGTLGLEAISRGAKRIDFVEKDYRNIRVIKENIALCSFKDMARVIKKDVFDFLRNTAQQYNLILLDPPYGAGMVSPTISLIEERGLLDKNGIIVAELGQGERVGEFNGLAMLREREYGDTKIVILQWGRGEN